MKPWLFLSKSFRDELKIVIQNVRFFMSVGFSCAFKDSDVIILWKLTNMHYQKTVVLIFLFFLDVSTPKHIQKKSTGNGGILDGGFTCYCTVGWFFALFSHAQVLISVRDWISVRRFWFSNEHIPFCLPDVLLCKSL